MVQASIRLILAQWKSEPGLRYLAAELSNHGSQPGYFTGRNPELALAAICSVILSDAERRHFAQKICKNRRFSLSRSVYIGVASIVIV